MPNRNCTNTLHVVLATVVGLVVLGTAPFVAAQTRAAPARIGVLSFGTAPSATDPDRSTSLSQGLRERAYVEGRNLRVERRYADARPERLAQLAAELVRLKVDVIFAGGPAPLQAASKATATIPIVAVSGSDPVLEGWAQSLARPGGNVTGLTVTFPELGPKRLEMLKDAIPGLVRVAMLWAPSDLPESQKTRAVMKAGANQLALELQVIDIAGPNDFDRAFQLARESRAQALYVMATNTVVSHRSRLAEMAARDRLLAISDFPLMAEAGFPITYGANLDDLLRRSAIHIDKILKGAGPGDLPIERPVKFELIVSPTRAKAMGVAIPTAFLRRADRLIE